MRIEIEKIVLLYHFFRKQFRFSVTYVQMGGAAIIYATFFHVPW